MKKAFVTGSTGFVGINLIEELIKTGWQVTALHRATSNLKYIKDSGAELVEGEITDKASLQKVMPDNLDAVFHVAGDTNMWHRNNARQTRTNVEGTRNMVEVAAQKKATCFIHTSSISAWGRVSGLITEETPQKGETSPINYEKSKWQAEREALKGMKMGLKVVILNPGSIIGPYDNNTWGQTFLALKKGEIPFSPPGENCFSHVSEIVKAHITAVDKGQNGHRYLVAGIQDSMPAFIKIISKMLGRKVPPPLPGSLFRFMGIFLSAISNITKKEPLLTKEVTLLVSETDYKFSSDKARRELGFKDVPLEVCIKDCYDWLVEEGVL